MALAPGTRLGAYEVQSVLGAGGFGEVYKARDTRLGRTVAIKVLPSADDELKARFQREAQAIAALRHPHICALFDVGTYEGTDYLVLEHLEGETLAHRLERGRLSAAEANRICTQIAEAIANAHASGVIHRDLKPANVMLTADGAKLLDFGLAKLRDEGPGGPGSVASTQLTPVTTEGSVLGTLHYMAPEQLDGKEADARSDVWAFGCLVYEMFTGVKLFDAPRTQPIVIRPRRISRIVRKCVERDPTRRWQSMTDVHTALAGPNHTRRYAVWTAVAVALGLLAIIGIRSRTTAPPFGAPRQLQTVLVADFTNSTGEAVFDGVIDRAMSLALENSALINVYARRDAIASASQIGHSTGLDDTVARLVARREGIPKLITGAISKAADGYDLSAAVLDAVSGTPLTLVTEKRVAKQDVLATVAKVGERLRAAIGDIVESSNGDLARETFTTSSLDAAKAYATAQGLATEDRHDEAIKYYQDAIRIDPEFGRAYAGWALALDNVGREAEAAELFQKAISLLARMNRRERLRTEGVYTSRVLQDYGRAAEIYRTLAAEYPADVAALNNLAVCEFMLLRFEQAFERGRAAVALSPNHVLGRVNLSLYSMYAGHFDQAVDEAQVALRLNDKATKAYLVLGVVSTLRGGYAEAAAWYEKMSTTTGLGGWLAELALADLDVSRQRSREAERRLLRRVVEDEAARNTTAVANSYAVLAEIAAAEGRGRDVERFATRGTAASSDPQFTYQYATALLDVNNIEAAIRASEELNRTRQVQATKYATMLNAELAAARRGDYSRLIPAARQTGSWWAYYRAGVVLSRAGRPEADEALRWCREHRGQGTAAFLTDVPTLRYYFAVERAQRSASKH